MDNPNVPWWLDPGLSVHLHRYALIPQDGDLHRATLSKHHSRHRAAPRSLQALSAPQAPSCPTHPCTGWLAPGVTPYPAPHPASGVRASPPRAQLMEPRGCAPPRSHCPAPSTAICDHSAGTQCSDTSTRPRVGTHDHQELLGPWAREDTPRTEQTSNKCSSFQQKILPRN